MITIDLREYQSSVVALPDATATALADCAGEGLTVAASPGADGFTITANSHVGTVVTPDVEVRIRPKVPVTNVLYLLTRGWERPWMRPEVAGHEEGDLTPAFFALFAEAVSQLLRRGPQPAYREHEEDLDTIRGRIDLVAQFRRPGLLVPVTCRFDELTVDTPPNRYLKHALRLALRMPWVWQRTRARLRHALAGLDAVSDVPPAKDLPSRMYFTRLNRAYEPVLRLAELARRRTGLRDVRGNTSGASFLLDMNDVFENFVEHGLREALRGQLQVEGQWSDHLDVDGAVRIRPDLLFRDARDSPVYVGDVKYKVASSGWARAADYYQLHAYCTRYASPEGILVYATTDDAVVPPRSVTTIGTGTRLRTHRLSLSGSPSEIDQRLQVLARTVVARVDADRSEPGRLVAR